MAIAYQKLTEKEIDEFIKMRIDQLREEGAKEEIDLAPMLRDYYKRHMADGTFFSWIAVDNGKIVGTSGMSIVEKPPYFGCPNGKIVFCQVCTRVGHIGEKGSPKHCFHGLSMKQGSRAAVWFRLLPPIWAYCYTPISALRKMRNLCNISCEGNC